MEEVEEANGAAVESCHRVISMLCQPQDQVLQFRNLMVETGEAVVRFKKVVSLLSSNGLGHARVRKLNNKLKTPFSQSILLDNPNCRTNHHQSTNMQFPQTSFPDNSIQELASSGIRNSLFLGNPSLELSSNGKSPLHLTQEPSSKTHYNILQQQQQIQQQQRLLLQQQQQHHQQMKHQAEMMFRRNNNNSVINLNFDSSSCTPSISSTRSFISSLSIDGSVANLDGGSGFRLVGGAAAHSSDQNSQQHKRKCSARGDEGSVKCGSSSARCHCSKKRKHRVKRSIKVPAISNKLADIPPDDYSWRKYGQKPIKGSPHPRGYYKCSSMRGCPARKHVERCLEEPTMLIVTYEGDHNHPKLPTQSANA